MAFLKKDIFYKSVPLMFFVIPEIRAKSTDSCINCLLQISCKNVKKRIWV